LFRGIPWLYARRSRGKFYRWYEELKDLEAEAGKEAAAERMAEHLGRLDRIEAAINRLRVPLVLFGEVNRLKEHVDAVRGKLERLRPNPAEKSP